jgi:hypothetical protein
MLASTITLTTCEAVDKLHSRDKCIGLTEPLGRIALHNAGHTLGVSRALLGNWQVTTLIFFLRLSLTAGATAI